MRGQGGDAIWWGGCGTQCSATFANIQYHTAFPEHVHHFNLINDAVAGLEGRNKFGGGEVSRRFSLEKI